MGSEIPTKEPFASWATLELFGHVRLEGYVREVDLFGATFVQIDVLDDEGRQGERRYFGASAVYSLTPTSEEAIKAEIARRQAWAHRRQQMYTPPQIEEAPPEEDDPDDDGDEEDEDREEGSWP